MPFTIGPIEGGVAPADHAVEIAALLRERDGYIARGMGDRVSQIEAVLERLGIERVERAVPEPAVTEKALKRRG